MCRVGIDRDPISRHMMSADEKDVEDFPIAGWEEIGHVCIECTLGDIRQG